MNNEEMIKNYTIRLAREKNTSPDIVCRNCRQKPGFYELHETRKRQMRFLVGNVVKVMVSFLLRWQCPLCNSTFTEYPSFLSPHKRFILNDMLHFCKKYLVNADLSYRDAAKHDGVDIGYPDNSGLCNQFLSHSTIWRFMGYLKNMHELNLKKYCSSENKPEPKKMPEIASSKYRSHRRLSLLHRAYKAIVLFRHLVDSKIFPNFETGYT